MILNEGLETLGTDEHLNGKWRAGIFENSALKKIVFPSTLKVIKHRTFADCKELKDVEFSKDIEKICMGAFKGSGLKSVEFPASLRTIA